MTNKENLPLGTRFTDGIEISSSSMSELGTVILRKSFLMSLSFVLKGNYGGGFGRQVKMDGGLGAMLFLRLKRVHSFFSAF